MVRPHSLHRVYFTETRNCIRYGQIKEVRIKCTNKTSSVKVINDRSKLVDSQCFFFALPEITYSN